MPRKNAKILAGLEVNLRFLKEIGIEEIDVPAKKKAAPRRNRQPTPRPADPSVLEDLHRTILACRLCGLAEGRTQAVPGEGNPRAELMFVGEGPGRDEDLQGRPFVGRAGQLLTKIIAAMSFDREPRSSSPTSSSAGRPTTACPTATRSRPARPTSSARSSSSGPGSSSPWARRPTDFFLPDAAGGMTSIRGRFYDWNGIRIMPTFHPSYLVRNEGNKEIKKMVWDDMQQVMALLGGK